MPHIRHVDVPTSPAPSNLEWKSVGLNESFGRGSKIMSCTMLRINRLPDMEGTHIRGWPNNETCYIMQNLHVIW